MGQKTNEYFRDTSSALYILLKNHAIAYNKRLSSRNISGKRHSFNPFRKSRQVRISWLVIAKVLHLLTGCFNENSFNFLKMNDKKNYISSRESDGFLQMKMARIKARIDSQIRVKFQALILILSTNFKFKGISKNFHNVYSAGNF